MEAEYCPAQNPAARLGTPTHLHGLELIHPAHSKLLTFEVQQIQILIRLFHGFSRYLPRVCERYGRFGC
jgi:hypothetical protein